MASVSLRAAAYPLFRAGVKGFKASLPRLPLAAWSRRGRIPTSPPPPIAHQLVGCLPTAARHCTALQVDKFVTQYIKEGDAVWGAIPRATPAEIEAEEYFYRDRSHPNNVGHRVLAEQLAAALMRAAAEVVAQQQPEGGVAALALAAWPAESVLGAKVLDLPPPMIQNNTDATNSLCAIQVRRVGQERSPGSTNASSVSAVPVALATPSTCRLYCLLQEEFEGAVTASEGFKFAAERPEGANFIAQKWAWTGRTPGGWGGVGWGLVGLPQSLVNARTPTFLCRQLGGARV